MANLAIIPHIYMPVNKDKEASILIEKRFLEVSKTDNINLLVFPIKKTNLSKSIEADKKKSKEFSEVFTPFWLVDGMIQKTKYNDETRTLDLCAGYGQFSIRLMRYYINNGISLENFFINNNFSELQIASCYKILYIFGSDINLFIGNSLYLNKLPENAVGIWFYIEKFGYWICLTKTIKKILKIKNISEEMFSRIVELIIKFFNGVYSDMEKLTVEMFMRDSKSRLGLLNEVKKTYQEAWQNIETPKELIKDMLDCLDGKEYNSILVLFNTEIIEQLIYSKKIDPIKITFATDILSEVGAKFVKKIYGVDYKIFKNGEVESIRSVMKGKKFDVILSNPPYNRGVDLKILLALLKDNIAKEYIIVHPSTWLLDQKDKTALYGNVKDFLKGKLKSIMFFNGNAVFDAELFVPCVITHIDVNYNNDKTRVVFFDERFDVDNIRDITKFGKNWLTIVKPFSEKIDNYIKIHGQVWTHNTRHIVKNKEYCQLAAIRGDVKDRGKKKASGNASKEITQDNFYTMLIDIPSCKGIRQPNLNRPGNPTPTFGFNTTTERDNFLSYLNTDFARFCLALLKNNGNLAVGEMELIPWLDFNQSWDDEKLFNHFDINKETQNYIRSFLPDYYKIRKP